MLVIGQDVTINCISSVSGLVASITDVKSCEMQYDREVKSEDFLGQGASKYYAVFKGVSGNIEFCIESAEILDVVARINTATKSRSPTAESFTIVGTFRFPDGARRIVIPKVEFGSIPLSTPERTSAITMKLEYNASDATTLAAT